MVIASVHRSSLAVIPVFSQFHDGFSLCGENNEGHAQHRTVEHTHINTHIIVFMHYFIHYFQKHHYSIEISPQSHASYLTNFSAKCSTKE